MSKKQRNNSGRPGNIHTLTARVPLHTLNTLHRISIANGQNVSQTLRQIIDRYSATG